MRNDRDRNDDDGEHPRQVKEKEYSLKRGATSYFIRRDRDGEWSLTTTRKLLFLFPQPDEVYELRKFPVAVFVCWVEDGVEFRELYLENRKGRRELISQMDAEEMEWFEEKLEKTGIELVYE